MFDPILELRRRRMLPNLPQITGNVQPPDAGPDINPTPAPLMQMQQPAFQPGPDLAPLAQLGAERGMNLLMKRLKPEAEAGASVPKGLSALKNLFRR